MKAMFETAVIEIAANIVRHGSKEGRTLCNLVLGVYPVGWTPTLPTTV